MKATTILLLLLLLSCAGGISWTTVVLCQPAGIGVPVCNSRKIHDGDPFAGALVDVLRTIWIHVDVLVKYPSAQHCYDGHDTYQLTTAYGSASCSVGLTNKDCSASLYDALTIIDTACGRTYGAQVTTSTCFLRFESYSFC